MQKYYKINHKARYVLHFPPSCCNNCSLDFKPFLAAFGISQRNPSFPQSMICSTPQKPRGRRKLACHSPNYHPHHCQEAYSFLYYFIYAHVLHLLNDQGTSYKGAVLSNRSEPDGDVQDLSLFKTLPVNPSKSPYFRVLIIFPYFPYFKAFEGYSAFGNTQLCLDCMNNSIQKNPNQLREQPSYSTMKPLFAAITSSFLYCTASSIQASVVQACPRIPTHYIEYCG